MLCDILLHAEGESTLYLLGMQSCLPGHPKSAICAGKTCHPLSPVIISGEDTFLLSQTQTDAKIHEDS